MISMLYDDSSMENVTGCSGRFFRVSKRIRAGTAILPFSFDSTCISVIIDVCRSEAVTVRLPLSSSKRKFSRMGTTGFVVMTPLILESCLSRYAELTINFIRETVVLVISGENIYRKRKFKTGDLGQKIVSSLKH